jgi:flagellar biosynthetic protein FliQ
MNGNDVLDIARDSIWVLLQVAGPLMGVALVVGLMIALLQALTQVQEMTLVFVPKIVAIFISLLILLPFMGQTLGAFMHRVAGQIAAFGA